MPRPPLFPLLRLSAVLAFAACLLLAPRPSPAPIPTTTPPIPAIPAPVWAVNMSDGAAMSWRPMERATGPLKGQKRPPCDKSMEVEYVGACWVPHRTPPPCPPRLFEGDGVCLVPVVAAQSPPVTLRPY